MADDAAGSAPSGPSLSDQLSKAIAAPLPGSGGGPSKPPVNSGRLREALGLDKIDANLAADDENLAALKQNMSFPKLTQPPPQQPQSDPFQAFGQPAMYLAIFGSLLTRNPLASAVNAGASVLKSTQAQDSAIGQQQYETWKINSENAVKLAQYEMNAYKAALGDKNSTIREKEVAMRTAAAVFKNSNLQTILDSEGVQGAQGYVKAYEKHVGDVVNTSGPAHEHLTAHIDGGGSGSGGAGGGAAGGTHAAAGALNADGRRQLVAQALDADDPKVNAQGVDLLARQLEGTMTGKVPASERAKMELTLTKLAKISADLRSGDEAKVAAARKEAGEIPEIGPGLLSAARPRAAGAGSLAGKEFDAVANAVQKEHPDWGADKVTLEANARIAASKRDPDLAADRTARQKRLANSLTTQESSRLKQITDANPGMSDKEFGNAVRLVTGRNELSPAEAIKLDEYQGHAVEGLDVGDSLLHTMQVTPLAVGVGGIVGRPLEAIGNWLGSDQTARAEFVRNLDRMRLAYSSTEQMTSGRPLAAQMKIIDEIIGGKGWGQTVANTADAIHDVQNELFHRIQRVDSERDGTYSWKTPFQNLDPVPWRNRKSSPAASDSSQYDSPH